MALVIPLVIEVVNDEGGALDCVLEPRCAKGRFSTGGSPLFAGRGSGVVGRGVLSSGRIVPSLTTEDDSCRDGCVSRSCGTADSGGESDSTGTSCNTVPTSSASGNVVTSPSAISLLIPVEGFADKSTVLLSKEDEADDPLAGDFCRKTSRRDNKEDGSRGCFLRLMLASNDSVSCQRSS
jgi:hypothetical protein